MRDNRIPSLFIIPMPPAYSSEFLIRISPIALSLNHHFLIICLPLHLGAAH